MQLELEYTAARAKRDDGMQRALDHAQSENPEWKTVAYTWLIGYAKTHAVFCGEEVSNAHIAAGLPQPPDLRAWGALYRKAVNEGYITHIDNNGWSKRRASPCPRYRSLVFDRSFA